MIARLIAWLGLGDLLEPTKTAEPGPDTSGYAYGGHLGPGVVAVRNNTGQPEPVLTPEDWR